MDWFKKHVDTMIILSTFAGAMIWMNGKFTDVDHKIFGLQSHFDQEISVIKTEMAIIKTVLIMQNVMPKELAMQEEK